MYFKNFPHDMLKIGNEYKYVTDIFRRVYTKTPSLNYSELETVTVPDGYTIEQASDKYYGSPEYHWVIAIVNNYVDIREEWPRANADLVKYCELKYGGLEGLYQTHHYVNDEGVIVSEDYTGNKTEITNMDYEAQINDAKREIQILLPKYLTDFVSRFQTLIAR
jgi:hypothetical protein